ncbi:hypothetical protein [Ralstonia solanacearum]|nr:hypothetical protein [Ralstonia solanacearum]
MTENCRGTSNQRQPISRRRDHAAPPALNRAGKWGAPAAATQVARDVAALFHGINACIDMSGRLHPIEGRNGGITPAWRTWTRSSERAATSSLAESLMATTRRSFEQNVALLCDAIRADPAWRAGLIDVERRIAHDNVSLIPPTAALMFWSRQHMLIEPTAALEQWLVHSDVGPDLPCGLFRPPAPACFIRIGDTFRDALTLPPMQAVIGNPRLQGVYVFDSSREENRAVAIVPIFEMLDLGTYGACSIELVINDEAHPLNEQIAQTCQGTELGQYFASLAQIVAKVFFYMEQPQAVHIEERSYSLAEDQLKHLGAKKAAKLVRRIPQLYDRIVLGPRELAAHAHGEVSPHLRRGHFRLQPHGPQSSLRKVIFLAPTWVRADRLARS